MPTFSGEVEGGGSSLRRRVTATLVVSVVVHAAGIAALLSLLAGGAEPSESGRLLVLAPPDRARPGAVTLPEAPSGEDRAARLRPPAPNLSGASDRGPGEGGALRWPGELALGDRAPGTGAEAERRRIGPFYERGHLWAPPLPFSPEEVAERLGLTHVELVDSAVKAIVQAYLDTLALDSSLMPVKPPSWVTEVAGLDFGLDSKFIYFAGLKIPTVLLALLPLPAGDFDREKRYNQMMEIRRDIYYSAWRAETQEEFKENVRKLRERKEEERRLREAQRILPGLSPDSSAPSPDVSEGP